MKPIEIRFDDRVVDEVKEMVSMRDAVTLYTDSVPRFNRIPCPIHNGHDNNFSFTQKHYKCFVCGASGDVIKFVEELFGTDFKGALCKLNDDFNLGLPLDHKATLAENLRLQKRYNERLEEHRKQQAIRDAYDALYNSLWDDWCLYDRALRELPPDSDGYAYAARHIDEVAYRIDTELEEVNDEP